MTPQVKRLLEANFSFRQFRAGQEEAINHILTGCHTLVVMPTGAGKSLIYQLTALCLPGQTLVISPLIALMKDQVDGLTKRGIAATYINSTLSVREQQARLRLMAQRTFHLVYIAPERLRHRDFSEALRHIRVSLLAVDEAHCISQWGHDFRPDYLYIAAVRELLGEPTTAALTATATPQVQDEIVHQLRLRECQRVVTGFNRPNLSFEVLCTPDHESKLRTLREFLRVTDGAGIIYVGTRRDSEEVADFVHEAIGIVALPYHAGLESAVREKTQETFIAGDTPVVVATNAFGMGVDRSDVRYVLHFTMPGTLEAYYQEAGRAGRDGLPARAVLFYSPEDRALQEWFIENDAPTFEELSILYEAVRSHATGGRVSFTVENLSLLTGIHEAKIKVGLAQLESASALQRLGDEGTKMWLEVKPLNPQTLQATSAKVQERRKHKRQQLQKMIAYAETNHCRRRIILDHFGDPGLAEAPACCDNCQARVNQTTVSGTHIAETPAERIALLILWTVREVQETFHWQVGRTKLAQILKGSDAQDIRRYNYHQLRAHGRLSELSLRETEELIQQMLDMGFVKSLGGDFPVLQLTPQGEQALQTKVAISLKLPREIYPDGEGQTHIETEAGNTLARQYSTEEITLLTLRCVTDFEGRLSPSDVARLLCGSKARSVRSLHNYELYGALNHWTIKQLRPFIWQLIERDQLVLIPRSRRKLKITPSGLSTLSTGARFLETQFSSAPQELGSATSSTVPRSSSQERARKVWELGEQRSSAAVSTLIDALHDPDGNVRRLSTSALGKIRDPRAVPALLELLQQEEKPQVRQYTIKALGQIGDLQARPILERIAQASHEQEYNRKAAMLALTKLKPGIMPLESPTPVSEQLEDQVDEIASFLSHPHPSRLDGPWQAGWALDFHSHFIGASWERTEIGELVHRYKYENETALADSFADHLSALVAEHPELSHANALVPVPPSIPRPLNPVRLLAEALSRCLGIPAWCDILVKTCVTAPQKEMHTRAQKRANVEDAFAVNGNVRGKCLLVLDDLYDSGATLEEVTRILYRAGASAVMILTLTRTIHTDA